MSDDTYLTEKGLVKLEDELEILKGKRKTIAKRIEGAKEFGDLSENAEYHAAREEHGFTEGRISDIERLIKSAIIVQKNGKTDMVNLGSKIKVRDDKGNEKEYDIVGLNEADPVAGKISNESPIGKAFMGKKVDDEIEVEVPKRIIRYIILEIT